MFRMWGKLRFFASAWKSAPDDTYASFDHLPFIDNETLDQFLADPGNIERLPVDPSEYSPSIQRMVVSAFLHEASTKAKKIGVA